MNDGISTDTIDALLLGVGWTRSGKPNLWNVNGYDVWAVTDRDWIYLNASIHGREPWSTRSVADLCRWTGQVCKTPTCMHGSLSNDGSLTCQCEPEYKGTFCNELRCAHGRFDNDR